MKNPRRIYNGKVMLIFDQHEMFTMFKHNIQRVNAFAIQFNTKVLE